MLSRVENGPMLSRVAQGLALRIIPGMSSSNGSLSALDSGVGLLIRVENGPMLSRVAQGLALLMITGSFSRSESGAGWSTRTMSDLNSSSTGRPRQLRERRRLGPAGGSRMVLGLGDDRRHRPVRFEAADDLIGEAPRRPDGEDDAALAHGLGIGRRVLCLTPPLTIRASRSAFSALAGVTRLISSVRELVLQRGEGGEGLLLCGKKSRDDRGHGSSSFGSEKFASGVWRESVCRKNTCCADV